MIARSSKFILRISQDFRTLNSQPASKLHELQQHTTMSVANNDTEQMSDIYDELIADAAEAETQRDAALARVAELEDKLRARGDGYPSFGRGDIVRLEGVQEQQPGMARWCLSTAYSCEFTIDAPANIDLYDYHRDTIRETHIRHGNLYIHMKDGTSYECKMMGRTIDIDHRYIDECITPATIAVTMGPQGEPTEDYDADYA